MKPTSSDSEVPSSTEPSSLRKKGKAKKHLSAKKHKKPSFLSRFSMSQKG